MLVATKRLSSYTYFCRDQLTFLLSLAGAATSIIFVATLNTCLCLSRQNTSFVATEVCLSRQNYVCHDKTHFSGCIHHFNTIQTHKMLKNMFVLGLYRVFVLDLYCLCSTCTVFVLIYCVFVLDLYCVNVRARLVPSIGAYAVSGDLYCLCLVCTEFVFVVTKHVFCRGNSMLVVTKLCLSRQNLCRNKTFVTTNICRDKSMLFETKVYL